MRVAKVFYQETLGKNFFVWFPEKDVKENE
jgi:hypothetical protein